MADQEGMKAIATAVAALRENPSPPEAFRWGRDGDYRLRVGPYRVMYRVKTDVILIGRVDRVAD
jgi:mRNA-degrading endonuclease RelE of RelBE toxin-antitoxin system